MKTGILLGMMLLAAGVVTAQAPQMPVTSAEFTPGTVRRQARAEDREARDQRFIAQQDSLVASRNFQFIPVSMYEIPGGAARMINNLYYYVAVFPDHAEVHIPTLRGDFNPFMQILNFDTPDVKEYTVTRNQWGWTTTFTAVAKQGPFAFSVNLYTATGEVILMMQTPEGSTIRYVGSIAKNEPQLGTPPVP